MLNLYLPIEPVDYDEITAPTPERLIAEAEQLLLMRHPRAATVTAYTAITAALHEKCIELSLLATAKAARRTRNRNVETLIQLCKKAGLELDPWILQFTRVANRGYSVTYGAEAINASDALAIVAVARKAIKKIERLRHPSESTETSPEAVGDMSADAAENTIATDQPPAVESSGDLTLEAA